jgi:hypothetical protein
MRCVDSLALMPSAWHMKKACAVGGASLGVVPRMHGLPAIRQASHHSLDGSLASSHLFMPPLMPTSRRPK